MSQPQMTPAPLLFYGSGLRFRSVLQVRTDHQHGDDRDVLTLVVLRVGR
ncbi:hypothetical protein [Kitasatospora sp. GP82]|nr:hypothetical protein [Kitasatospora sp. GP82]